MNPFQVEIPIATAIAALAAVAFMVARARQREREFSAIDSLMLVILMTIAAAGGVTLVEIATHSAKEAALCQNLREFRTQIEVYKLQHGGETPLLYDGTFPQLIEATNAQGVPGRPGEKFPFGPYFRSGIPQNPITGRSMVSPAESNPPTAPSGYGGWLYHQESGMLNVDLAEYLDK